MQLESTNDCSLKYSSGAAIGAWKKLEESFLRSLEKARRIGLSKLAKLRARKGEDWRQSVHRFRLIRGESSAFRGRVRNCARILWSDRIGCDVRALESTKIMGSRSGKGLASGIARIQ